MNRFLFCCVLLAIRTSLVRVLFLFFISIGVVIVLSSILVDDKISVIAILGRVWYLIRLAEVCHS
ncbi:hypothetical protein MANES_16G062701v8 [Manihot esculenta]|uniref:Uncharacterized protein n=1 Tax=Manihot esculenta TaxID=3983 RepID=A0ACB7G7F4_MANES|nr:hypothetical protein MANES_16G062701v8 [Manihot esculenta]